jgi:hypothetical protein
MSVKVVHISSRQAEGSHREYCGRTGKGQEGILGNPYWMNDESKRDEVCDKFKLYLKKEFEKGNSKVHKRAYELVAIAKKQDLELACFCAPKRCHTESIKELIEGLLENNNEKA